VGAQELTLGAGGNCGFGFSLWDFGGGIGKKEKQKINVLHNTIKDKMEA